MVQGSDSHRDRGGCDRWHGVVRRRQSIGQPLHFDTAVVDTRLFASNLDNVYAASFPDPVLDGFVRLASDVHHAVRSEFVEVVLVERVDRQPRERARLRTVSDEVRRVDHDDGVDRLVSDSPGAEEHLSSQSIDPRQRQRGHEGAKAKGNARERRLFAYSGQ